jgi:hypothetical protein
MNDKEEVRMYNKINYTKIGDYYIPNIVVPESKPIGKYGRLHLKYLKENRKGFYTSLLVTGKLNDYLHKIDTKAKITLGMLMQELAVKQGITEKLKAENQMEWVGGMNNIRQSANEILNHEIIYQHDIKDSVWLLKNLEVLA